MKKFMLILFIMSLFLITSCNQIEETNSKNEGELKEKLQELTDTINEKEKQIKELT